MKRFIAMLLCVLTVFSLLPVSAFAEGEPVYTWAEDHSTCTATLPGEEPETVTATSSVKTPATCAAKGVTTYTAVFTGASFTTQTEDVEDIAIDPDNHTNWEEHTAEAATCSATGNVAYWECKDCGKLFTDKTDLATETTPEAVTLAIDPAAHNLTHEEANAPTCTEDGNTEYWYCEDCHTYFADSTATKVTTLEAVTVSATGHIDVTYSAPVYPTCSTAGKQEYWYCDTCEKYFSDIDLTEVITDTSTLILAPTNHKDSKGNWNTTHYAATEPTYFEKGSVEYWKCNACGKIYTDEDCTAEAAADKLVTDGGILIATLAPDTPVLTLTVENRVSVKLESTAVFDATGYIVYRYVTAEGKDTAAFLNYMNADRTYTDTTAVAGVEYTYYIRAYIKDETGTKVSYSLKSNEAVACVEPAQPTGVGVTVSGTIVTLTWAQAADASGYDIYYSENQTDASSYVSAGTVKSGTKTTFQQKELLPGHIYYYKVRAYTLDADGNRTSVGAFSSPSIQVIIPLDTPAVTLTKETAAKVKVSWKAIDGAEGYTVTVSGNPGYSVTVTDCYTVLDLAPNASYSITVSAFSKVSGSEVKSADAIQSIALSLSAPTLTAIKSANVLNTVELSWSRVSGADKYRVYNMDDSSNPKLISEQSGLSFPTAATPGMTHYYAVKAVWHAGESNEVESALSSVKCVSLVFGTPVLKSVTKTSSTEITLKWSEVEAATEYYIYRKTKTDPTYQIADAPYATVSGSTLTYVDETPAGETYYYKVVAVYDDGVSDVIRSAYSAEKSVTLALAAPSLSASKKSATKVTLSWKTVTNASAYRVYCSTTKTGTFTQVAEVATVSGQKTYTYTYEALPGKTYYFYVKSVSTVGSATNESAKSSVKGVTLSFSAPSLTVKKKTATTATLTWKPISGASYYTVYVSKGSKTAYTELKQVSETGLKSYTETVELLPGTTYYFKMVAVAEVGGVEKESSASTVRSIKLAFAAPSLTVKKASATSVKLTWKAVSMAEKYRVYYKLSTESSYTQYGEDILSSDTRAVTIEGLLPGKTYNFKVVGIKSVSGTEAIGDASVKSLALPFAAPSIKVTKDTNNAIIIKWNAVTPATSYVIQVSTVSTFATCDTYSATTTALQINGYSAGKRYIRVWAVYDNGVADPVSSSKSKTASITLK